MKYLQAQHTPYSCTKLGSRLRTNPLNYKLDQSIQFVPNKVSTTLKIGFRKFLPLNVLQFCTIIIFSIEKMTYDAHGCSIYLKSNYNNIIIMEAHSSLRAQSLEEGRTLSWFCSAINVFAKASVDGLPVILKQCTCFVEYVPALWVYFPFKKRHSAIFIAPALLLVSALIVVYILLALVGCS